MKITSRPDEEFDDIGTGINRFCVTDDELTLIAALLSHVRLGRIGYSHVAYDLIRTLEDEFGDNFLEDSCNIVDINATIEDDAGLIVCATKGSNLNLTIEV